jgi:bifunctional NMN adenylyltransferase/nudix hydrolase
MSKVKFDFVDGHKSEYWYKCDACGATDWFAHYARPTNLNECLPTCKRKAQDFDALVFIGRFSPFHNGHKAVIDEALKRAKEVIVVVGSSFAARNIRNPFTFEERRDTIKAVFPQGNVKVVPVADYPYDDSKWIAAVQNVVYGAIASNGWEDFPPKIGLIGHEKDGTSYYLKIFPTWGSVSVANVDGINATDIRVALLGDNKEGLDPIKLVPKEVAKIIAKIIGNGPEGYSEAWLNLRMEYLMIKKYKESWASAPFPPTFVTVDAVVVQSGHVLLVKRGAMPGKGLWALPGGFLNQDETMLDGAIRELKEETKIKVPVPVLKGSIKGSQVFDLPNRSQRGRTITQAFFIDLGFDMKLPKVTGADDAEKAFWVPLNDVVSQRDKFFEDHFAIISYFTKIG